MSIATKTLATLMMVAMISIANVGGVSASSQNRSPETTENKHAKQLDRLYRKHDKKMELRASVLGMSPEELKAEVKQRPFAAIRKKAGFKTDEAFHTAVIGKLKQELHSRGWSENDIYSYISKKVTKIVHRS